MPVRKGKCINFGLCPKADSREIITVNDGEEFSCPFPDCRKQLQPLTTPPPPPPPPWLVIGGIVVVLLIIVTVVLWHPWRKQILPVDHDDTKANAPQPVDPCERTDWKKASANNLLATDCKGRKIAAYDERMVYIESLKMTNWASVRSDDPRINDCAGVPACEERRRYIESLKDMNWATVKPDDPKLRDCAGVQACEERAQRHLPPPLPRAGGEKSLERDWSKASCEDVVKGWQDDEDHRLSTPTCEGLDLSRAACSNIQRCLGLHPLNTGPGNSPN